MLHSDVFTAAVTLSGYFHTLRDSTTGDLWGGSRVLKNLNDLEWRLRHLPPPPVSLLVTTAKDEAGSSGYADSRRFLRPGAHGRRTSARGLPDPRPRRPQLQHLERRAAPGPQLAHATPARPRPGRLSGGTRRARGGDPPGWWRAAGRGSADAGPVATVTGATDTARSVKTLVHRTFPANGQPGPGSDGAPAPFLWAARGCPSPWRPKSFPQPLDDP